MARYKAIDLSPRFLAVDLEKQLLPGSFAHAVHYLLDHDFDLSSFDARYRNDDTGASAYPPGMLLKITSVPTLKASSAAEESKGCAANTSASSPSPATVPRTSRPSLPSSRGLEMTCPSSLPKSSTSATDKDSLAARCSPSMVSNSQATPTYDGINSFECPPAGQYSGLPLLSRL